MSKFSLVIFTFLILHFHKSNSQERIEIPFELIEERLYIKLLVNSLDTINFVFDTGASVTVIDSKVEKQLGLQRLHSKDQLIFGNGGDVSMRQYNNQYVNLGADILQLDILSVPFTNMQRKYNPELQGLIGTDIYRKYVVEINYTENKIYLYKTVDKIKNIGQYSVAPIIKGRHDIFFLDIFIKIGDFELQGRFCFDTGAANVRLYRTSIVSKAPYPNYETIMYGVSQKSTSQSVFRTKELTILDSTLINFPVTLKEEGPQFKKEIGDLGNNILKRFDVIIDYKKGQIYFKPSLHYSSDFAINKCGLEIVYSRDFNFFVVDNVIKWRMQPNVNVGDTIDFVNETPAEDMTIFEVREILNNSRDSVEVKFRNGERRTTTKYLPKEII